MMKLHEIIKGVEVKKATGNMDVEISGVAYDSRSVTPGSLFVGIRGHMTDGHLYIKGALSKGAAALLIENASEGIMPSIPVPTLIVSDSRKAIARIAVNYYGNPSRALKLIGVTGTNGKTTTTYLIKSILEGLYSEGLCNKVGLIGTISYSNGDMVTPADRTTPESTDFQRLLRKMADNGCMFAVAEVSSHALTLDRVYGTEFNTAVFTNLTQDHLDFHAGMEDYFYSKSMLFSNLSPQNLAIINADDPYGSRLAEMTKCSIYTYGLKSEADVRGDNVRLALDGIEFDAITPAGRIHIKSRLAGIYNVYNILAAIGVALGHNIPHDKIASGILSVSSIPGRFEKIDSGHGFRVVVDYAHTENALRMLLEGAAGITPNRIITLFGCGGDRDRGKRALMGKAAVELSDYVIVTSDNPRSEEPDKIIEEIETGIKSAMTGGNRRASGYRLIADRRTAIEEAINMAEKDDLVIIAGKGHECYQITGNDKLHFDDREEALSAIKKRRGNADYRRDT